MKKKITKTELVQMRLAFEKIAALLATSNRTRRDEAISIALIAAELLKRRDVK